MHRRLIARRCSPVPNAAVPFSQRALLSVDARRPASDHGLVANIDKNMQKAPACTEQAPHHFRPRSSMAEQSLALTCPRQSASLRPAGRTARIVDALRIIRRLKDTSYKTDLVANRRHLKVITLLYRDAIQRSAASFIYRPSRMLCLFKPVHTRAHSM
jgi:hypothetical protein